MISSDTIKKLQEISKELGVPFSYVQGKYKELKLVKDIKEAKDFQELKIVLASYFEDNIIREHPLSRVIDKIGDVVEGE